MPRKNRHPEREILELINGALAGPGREAVEAHLAECDKCASVAGVVAALKKQARTPPRPASDSRVKGPAESGPIAYGSLLPTQGGPAGGSAQGASSTASPTGPPTGLKDLEFKDLLQDADVSRPPLSRRPEGSHPSLESVARGSSAHLDAADLASFFYGELPGEAAAAAAGHVAMCADCSSAISLYSDSEAAAGAGADASGSNPEMPVESWRLIKEWEENCLAEPRPESETPSREMLEKFIEILRDHKDEIDRVASGQDLFRAVGRGASQIVPVVVLDSSGGFRSVEPFRRISRPRGLEALQSQSTPNRFNNLPIHALFGAGPRYPMVVSGRINRGIAELDYGSVHPTPMRPVGYFIVEN
jgi:hypothetical protein